MIEFMAQYIDKDALVAEIERKIDILIKNSGYIGVFGENQITIYEDILSLINSLKVKEVDLEKEMDEYFDEHDDEFCREEYLDYAKHFFELGIKAQKGEEV